MRPTPLLRIDPQVPCRFRPAVSTWPRPLPTVASLRLLPAVAATLLVVTGCQGELDQLTPTPAPPGDPHDQTGDDETIYWDTLGQASSTSAFYAIAGFADDALFVAGDSGALWSWDGATLQPEATLTTTDGELPGLSGLWAHTDVDGPVLFAAGDYGSIFRSELDADGFAQLETGTRAAFRGIFGFARDDVWAVGDGGIYHFDGSTWVKDTSAPGNASLVGIWGPTADMVFAVGHSGTLLQRASGAWTPVALGRGEDLHAVWGTGPGSVWVAGQEGLILHYDGQSWTVQETGVFDHLWSIWGVDDSKVFATGTNGLTLYFDGQSWQRLPAGSNRNLYGLWGIDLQHVYTVGSGATFLRFDNDPAPAATAAQ